MNLFGSDQTISDILKAQQSYSNPWPWPKACNCVGGDNCCIKVGERAHEAAIRADERRKVMEELGQ